MGELERERQAARPKTKARNLYAENKALRADAEALREALREICDKTAHGEVHRIARAALEDQK